jgi:LytS/YehU family sensor histidine kinase
VNYNKARVALLAFTGMLGGLSVGYNCGIVAGVNLYLDELLRGQITLSDKSV